ncbi:MAG: hypothetical protein J7L89_08735, partial [Bacteroidales bacterium]|nr:hypothetical protein [Bacteroidales bacterium]
SDADDGGWRDSGDVGKRLKSTSGWYSNGNGDNSSGFNALPGGHRYDGGGFDALGYYADFWSSTEGGDSGVLLGIWVRNLDYGSDGVSRGICSRRSGFSIRCLKN